MRLHVIPDSFQSYPAVIVLDERIRTYESSSFLEVLGKPKKIFYTMYTRYHRIIRIQEDSVASQFARIVFPLSDGELLEDLRWRVLRPDGSVVTPHAELYKDSTAGTIDYKLFDLEGLNGKGTEVEYSYTIDKPFSSFGAEVFGNEAYPILESRFVLVQEDDLKALLKGYNGFQVGPEQRSGHQGIFTGYATNLLPPSHEAYSMPLRDAPYVSYDLLPSDINNPMDHTWDRFAYRLVPGIVNHTRKEEQAAREVIKRIILPSDTTVVHRISAVEEYVKTHFVWQPDSLQQSGKDPLLGILTSKTVGIHDLLTLYSALFDALNISYEIVFPGDRNGMSPDPDLSVWGGLNNPLLYFPASDHYLEPGNWALRYPYVNPLMTGTLGLFLEIAAKREQHDYPTSFREILPLPADSNTMHMDMDISFNHSMDTALLTRAVRYTGYLALHPGLGDTVMSVSSILRSEGDSIRVYIGTLIGTQPEMTREAPRSLPVDLYFPYEERWRITLHIPPGYVVRNTAELNKGTLYTDGNGPSMGFVTEYKQHGDTLELIVRKGFLRIEYPVSQWDKFLNVTQDAADFNAAQIELVPIGKG